MDTFSFGVDGKDFSIIVDDDIFKEVKGKGFLGASVQMNTSTGVERLLSSIPSTLSVYSPEAQEVRAAKSLTDKKNALIMTRTPIQIVPYPSIVIRRPPMKR